jgi:hypothetical protein
MMTRKILTWSCAVVAGAAILVPQRASATVLISLSAGNSDISGFPGAYGEVLVTRTSPTTADITLTALSHSPYAYLFGDGSTLGLNVNSTSFSASVISFGQPPQPGHTTPDFSVQYGSQQVDGQGNFNVTFNNMDGSNKAVSSLTVQLTDLSGTWASDSAVLIRNGPNTTDNFAAGHVFVYDSSYIPISGTNTGYAGGNSEVEFGPVPEPSTLILGISGVVGFGLTRVLRRLRRA